MTDEVEPEIRGCGTALITPFQSGGEVDLQVLTALVRWQVGSGVDFLVPCGSTGEAPALEADERLRVIETVVRAAEGRVPVMAGTGASSTRAALEFSGAAAVAGATHLLVVTPPYVRPPQRGLLQHFRTIADASPLPLVLYNVPGRTGCNLRAETVLALAEHPRIVGIKEASGDLAQIQEILAGRPADFAVLSGDDALTFPIIMLGGHGVISVVSNVAPAELAALVRAAREGKVAEARKLHAALGPLMEASFVESNPIPIKAALAELGWIEEVLRPPLVPLDPVHRARIRSALSVLGKEKAVEASHG